MTSTKTEEMNNTPDLVVETASGMEMEENMETISLDAVEPIRANRSSDSVTLEEVVEEQSKRAFYTRLVVGLIFVAFVVFVIVDSATNMHALDALHDFLQWVEENPSAGVFAFVVVYFVATVFFIPGALLTLGAGFVYGMAFGLGPGVALGSLAVFVGACLGAIVSFLLGRYLLQRQMHKLTKKYAIFEALEAALKTKGLRIFILLRLSPIIPFSLLNYLGGITAVSLRDYVIALVFILPGTVLYVFLGATAGSLTDSATSGSNSTVTIIVTVVGAVFGILAIAVTSRYAKAELNRVLEERRIQDELDDLDGSLAEEGVGPKMEDESTTQQMDDSALTAADLVDRVTLAVIQEDDDNAPPLEQQQRPSTTDIEC